MPVGGSLDPPLRFILTTEGTEDTEKNGKKHRAGESGTKDHGRRGELFRRFRWRARFPIDLSPTLAYHLIRGKPPVSVWAAREPSVQSNVLVAGVRRGGAHADLLETSWASGRMKSPERDSADRSPVWDALQMVYMDTDFDEVLQDIAEVCARSKYSVGEIRDILFEEVFPACRFNMVPVAGSEWRGFDMEWLTQRIIAKQRHGKRWPLLRWRGYTKACWRKLEEVITRVRAEQHERAGKRNEDRATSE